MYKYYFVIALICQTLITTAQHNNLKSHQWENRILLVFAPSDDHDLLEMQVKVLEADKSGMEERDLITYIVLKDKTLQDEKTIFSAKLTQELRDQYQIGVEGFAVILIGKDGGEKLRTDGILSLKSLYQTIDVMPMRRAEMNNHKKKRGYHR